jgi:hypothetical protein
MIGGVTGKWCHAEAASDAMIGFIFLNDSHH